jgi:hypothetical protein
VIEQYERQGHPYYASARLWDDGVIDPAQESHRAGAGAGGLVGPRPARNSTASSGCKEFTCPIHSVTLSARFSAGATGPLAELVLDRPARHNAFDADLMLGLLDCLDELAHTHARPSPTPPRIAAAGRRQAFLRRRRPQLDAQPGSCRFRAQPRTPGCWPG